MTLVSLWNGIAGRWTPMMRRAEQRHREAQLRESRRRSEVAIAEWANLVRADDGAIVLRCARRVDVEAAPPPDPLTAAPIARHAPPSRAVPASTPGRLRAA